VDAMVVVIESPAIHHPTDFVQAQAIGFHFGGVGVHVDVRHVRHRGYHGRHYGDTTTTTTPAATFAIVATTAITNQVV